MPHVSGPDLAKRLVTLQPTMKILFMSGYVDDGVLRRSVVQALTAYVQKPITPEALTSKVREVLDASDVGSGEPAVDGESMHRQRSSG
jgi:CheY-like chemotaxis protein